MKQNADLFEGAKIEACGQFCTKHLQCDIFSRFTGVFFNCLKNVKAQSIRVIQSIKTVMKQHKPCFFLDFSPVNASRGAFFLKPLFLLLKNLSTHHSSSYVSALLLSSSINFTQLNT